MITIYKITNKITNQVYIGQTSQDIKKRISGFDNYRSCPKLNEALKQHGKINFKYEVLEIVEEQFADNKERYYIEKYDAIENGYNSNCGGKSGFEMLKKSKEKLSIARKGQHNSIETEFKKGMTPWSKGKKFSEETRRKISETHKGKHNSPRTEFKKGDMEGAKNPTAYPVYQYTLDGKFIAKYETAKEASEKTGINRGNICSCRTGRLKSYAGYLWLKEPLER